MGTGFCCKCEKCGFEVDIMLGVGRLFFEIYQKLVARIRKGEFGEEWRKFFEENPDGAVDSERNLFLCENCGNWKEDYNLSLFKLISSEKTEIPLRYFPAKLENYILYKIYIHSCKRCGHDMKKIEESNEIELNCPKCENKMIRNGLLRWD